MDLFEVIKTRPMSRLKESINLEPILEKYLISFRILDFGLNILIFYWITFLD